MAAGQAPFSVAADTAALDVLAERLTAQETDRGPAHVAQLRTLLEMHAAYSASGMGISTVPHAALAMNSSEHRVGRLLTEAMALVELPGALEAVECGLLGVEQSTTVVQQLSPLPLAARLDVWARLQQRLVGEADRGSVLPPARLAELLRQWVVEADAADAVERRRRAEEGRRLDYRRRDDGLGDLFALGFTGPDLHAVLSRIRDRAHPVGAYDERTADQRRFDALKDMLLGRDPLPVAHDGDDGSGDAVLACSHRTPGRASCGCWPGSPVPCGAQLLVHVTLAAALGTSDQPAELVGHGPLDPGALADLLHAAPRTRAVWTDEHGVPVAVGDRVLVPRRDDPASVRTTLLELAAQSPDLRYPRHPYDHPASSADPPDVARSTSSPRRRVEPPLSPPPAVDPHVAAAGLGAHPAGAAGGYRLPRRLRRLIDVRAPRCEWPGCGARAVRCDAEHYLAWPNGPTCACNLGPCCRRHHRVKQLGWSKQRGAGSAVTWTSPGGGRRWVSPSQHEPPAADVRPLAAVPADDPLRDLSAAGRGGAVVGGRVPGRS